MSEDTRLAAKIQTLRASARALNISTDNLNEVLTKTVTAIVNTQIGIEVWLDKPPVTTTLHPAATNDEQPPTRVTQLGFAKLKDGWHIAVRDLLVTKVVDKDGDAVMNYRLLAEPRAIANASRQERAAAWRYLPQLVDAMQAAVQDALNMLREAYNRNFDGDVSTLVSGNSGDFLLSRTVARRCDDVLLTPMPLHTLGQMRRDGRLFTQ